MNKSQIEAENKFKAKRKINEKLQQTDYLGSSAYSEPVHINKKVQQNQQYKYSPIIMEQEQSPVEHDSYKIFSQHQIQLPKAFTVNPQLQVSQPIHIIYDEDKLLQLYLQFPQFPDPNRLYSIQTQKNNSFKDFQEQIIQQFNISEVNTNICFFSANGTSYFNTINNYDMKLCNEEFNDFDKVFCIFTRSQEENEITSFYSVDPSYGPDTLFVYCNEDYLIRCDILKDTIANLKQKIFIKSGIPSSIMQINKQSQNLNNNQLLIDCGIKNFEKIKVNLLSNDESPKFDSFSLYNPVVQHMHENTKKGMRELRSHLILLRKHLSEEYKIRMLGLLRDISNNNAPMIQSLQSFFFGTNLLSLSQQISLEEGLFITISNLLYSYAKQFTYQQMTLAPDNVFEFSRLAFSLIIQYITSMNQTPQLWKNREVYIQEFTCEITNKPITEEPVYIQKDNYQLMLCEKPNVQKCITKRTNVSGITNLTADKIISSNNLKTLFRLMKRHPSTQFWFPNQNCINLQIGQEKISQQTLLSTDWQKQLTSYFDQNPFYIIYQAQELKYDVQPPCLVLNNKGELLIFKKTFIKDQQSKFVIRDVLQMDDQIVDFDELIGYEQRNYYYQKNYNTIPYITSFNQVSEAIAIVIDSSQSMNDYFDYDLKNVETIQAFINAFIKRCEESGKQQALSLIFFNELVQIKCNFTTQLSQIRDQLNQIQVREKSRLFDGIDLAIEQLIQLKQKYPHIIQRIISIKISNEENSMTTEVAISRKLMNHKIVLDSIQIGTQFTTIKSISKLSGGESHLIQTHIEGIQLFESEHFLSLKNRELKGPGSGQDSNSFQIQQEFLNSLDASCQSMLDSYEFNKPATLDIEYLLTPPNQDNQSSRISRIQQELKELSDDPNQNYKVFPLVDDITFWKVIMKSPKQSNYSARKHLLQIQFPMRYPIEPPIFKFVSQIYHSNVGPQGQICHTQFYRLYKSSTKVMDMLQMIYNLLNTPEPNHNSVDFNLYTYEYYIEKLSLSQQIPNMKLTDSYIVNHILGTNSNQRQTQQKEKIKRWLDEKYSN